MIFELRNQGVYRRVYILEGKITKIEEDRKMTSKHEESERSCSEVIGVIGINVKVSRG